jgi:hypothetical protein
MGEYEQWVGPLLNVPPGERTWEDEQEWERRWWADCANTYGEETKQLTYAHRMGLQITPWAGRWPVYDMEGRSVIDFGGGPASMLLKCANVTTPRVVDPCPWPQWVYDRYAARRIGVVPMPAEDFERGNGEPFYTEAWIYNVLQHVRDPEAVVMAARNAGETVRIFEWLETPASPGHPHTIREDDLNRWLSPRGRGTVELMDENGCVGLAYYGAFPL